MQTFKTIIFISTLFLIASCSKSSDSAPNPAAASGNIVGKWNIDRAGAIVNGNEVDIAPFDGNIAGCAKDFQEFSANGDYKLGDYGTGCNFSAATGTYTKDGNIIKISGGQFATYEIESISATNLKLKFKNPSISTVYTDTYYLIKN